MSESIATYLFSQPLGATRLDSLGIAQERLRQACDMREARTFVSSCCANCNRPCRICNILGVDEYKYIHEIYNVESVRSRVRGS